MKCFVDRTDWSNAEHINHALCEEGEWVFWFPDSDCDWQEESLFLVRRRFPDIEPLLKAENEHEFTWHKASRTYQSVLRNPRVDEDTYATRQARLRLNPLRWLFAYPSAHPLVVGGLGVVLYYSFVTSFWFLAGAALILVRYYKFWVHVLMQFRLGYLCPGIVVAVEPNILVAFATDMAKGDGAFPVLKVVQIPRRIMGKAVRVGMRVVGAAFYFELRDNRPFWCDVEPYIAQAAVGKKVRERSLARIAFEEWNELDRQIKQLPKLEPGLFRVDRESSSWSRPLVGDQGTT